MHCVFLHPVSSINIFIQLLSSVLEMESKCVALILTMVVVMTSFYGVTRGFSLCNLSDDQLLMCKPAVTQPNPVDPSPECCKALSGADLECLCSYKNSPELPLLGIDPDLAIALPAKCNLTPPTNCNLTPPPNS